MIAFRAPSGAVHARYPQAAFRDYNSDGAILNDVVPRGKAGWSLARQTGLVVSIWLSLLTFNCLNNYIDGQVMGKPVSWRDAVVYPLSSYCIWIVLTAPILAFTGWVKRAHFSLIGRTVAHLLFSIVVMMFNAIGWIPFPRAAHPDLAAVPRVSWHFVEVLFLQNMEWNFWLYLTIVGISYGLSYYHDVREARLYAAELESQLSRAQLQALKQQLRPHFLFNTLNSVSALMHTNLSAADDMLANLSTLLRLSLEHAETHNVPLKDEMEAVRLYINIQQARFGDKFTVEMNVDPGTLEAYVPHLVLQPLVENAFRHGLSKRSSAGRLRILAERTGENLRLGVADNGPGSAKASGEKTGIGLKNTRARLWTLYGDLSAVKIDDSDRGFSVELQFPFIRRSSELI